MQGTIFMLVEIASAHKDVPVIAENVGPYPSLEAALKDWPEFREATTEEYERYYNYWSVRD